MSALGFPVASIYRPRGSGIVTPARFSLIGRIRAAPRGFGDDTGPRNLLFVSWFPALRIWRDDRQRAIDELDDIAASGWLGIRVFLAVGGWSTYWDGREVCPIDVAKWVPDDQHHAALHGTHIRTESAWPDYDELLASFLVAVKARGLKLNTTLGDMQMIAGGVEEVQLHERLARIVRDVDPTIVALWETWNEPFQNNELGEGDPGIDERAKTQGRRIMEAVRAILPGQLCSMGSSTGSEEPDPMRWWCEHADVMDIHGLRSGDGNYAHQIARAFGVAYWGLGTSGFEEVGNKPIWQGEPAGPDGPGVNRNFQPTNDPAHIWALYVMHVLTGQGTVYHGGSGVRYLDTRLSDMWGFKELPALLSVLPDDICTWRLIHGNHETSIITADRFSDTGNGGPERIDQAFNDSRVAALVYGGEGEWPIVTRRNMKVRVFDHTGQLSEDTVNAGRLPGQWHADNGPRLILGEFV